MKNKVFQYTIYFLFVVCCIHTAQAIECSDGELYFTFDVEQQEDSIKPRYSVRKTSPVTLEDLSEPTLDFKNPDNIVTEIKYDEKNNLYIVGTKAGDEYVDVPLYLTPEEYAEWSMKKSMEAYYRTKNGELFSKEGEKFDFADMKFDIGPAEKIFGPGGVQLKTQGSAELKFGVKYSYIDNPSIAIRARRSLGFDFDEKINVNINGKVGDKVNLNMNYNTDATFDFDSQKIKLKYEGKEDEIIKLLEAGNVSMPTNSSLIRGATSLFGIRADLQFGKLLLQTVVSQQESESKTVTSKGGAQTTEYEISIEDYDENRHFFLSHFFQENYDSFMSKLPQINSGIEITNIEVWITNKRANTDNPRNIVGFTDLAEGERIDQTLVQSNTGNRSVAPYNGANSLYNTVINKPSLRDISLVTSTLTDFTGGVDYDKIENARLLTSSEYNVNTKLGYISLKQTLQADEVLAVAYSYSYKGTTYQVGEFSTDIKDNNTLFVKLLKSTSNSPKVRSWKLMMKNVYSLNAYQIQSDRFRMDILYQSDTLGVYLNYIPEGKIDKTMLIKVMNLDRLNSKNQETRNGDGFFDYVEGYTIDSQTGRVYFPVAEPFGSHLRKAFENDNIANKYVFEELYDSTKTVAKQIAEKNKFKLKGEYKASSGSEIRLGAMNVPVGSVSVKAGGITLIENAQYIVDYTMGIVTITDQSIIDAGTSITVNLESNTNFSMQRKTMVGMNFIYDFTNEFQLGGSIMHLKEKPLMNKVAMGDEPISNTLWGLNMSWKKQSQWLTNMVDKIPFVNATQPSNISFTAEFAHLIAGHASGIQDDASYIDDFESTKIGIDVRYPSYWMLASTPAFRKEGKKSNDIEYGKYRALLNWFYIDPIFTRKSSNLTPSHIKNDVEQLSSHYVREVYESEIYTNKDNVAGVSSTISVLNLAYYPDERGPYNLDTNLTYEGKLTDPADRWGGMMRKLDATDFEANNIEYIEFWLLDPFIYNPDHKGGKFQIHLGEISEDVLKDGKKFFENGIPVDGDLSKVEETVWGYVPKDRSVVYAFDTSDGARKIQDTGLNGLLSEQEREFGAYRDFLNAIQDDVSPEAYQKFYDDPAGDNYHYFRGSDYDEQQLSILERYKRYNNTEGNSSGDDNTNYTSSAKTTPDVEDINQDYTLNETESFFIYEVDMSPSAMQVGSNFIVNKQNVPASLRNGNREYVDWYQFKIPLKSNTGREGTIEDFKSIRFMRLYLEGFEEPIILRFATLELVRGEWRTYEQDVDDESSVIKNSNTEFDVSAVNYEESGKKEPVNYVLPPGITRVIDSSQSQLTQLNEQSMSLTVKNLAPGDARAVYKNAGMDMRQYNRLQMFIHGEQLIDDNTDLQDGEMSVFIRLGTDYKNNYYEYEIPLTLTPHGSYDQYSTSERLKVWPEENMLNINFSLLTDLKKERNRKRSEGDSNASYTEIYSTYDKENPANKISVRGNPSLAEVKTLMIGIRNNAMAAKSVEVWVNELRLTDFNEEGGWAAQGNLNVQLSDLGIINVGGHVETAGFGGLEQSVSERRLDDYYQYSFTTSFELGKFFPAKAKITAPIYFSYSKEINSPKYNPLDQDILLKDALDALTTKYEKDSLKSIAREVTTYKNFSLSNIRVGITSKNPMPYDPSNFTFGYSFIKRYNEGSTTQWESDRTWQGNFGYAYSPALKPWEPFKQIKSKSKWMKIIKEQNFSFVPQSIGFNTDIKRQYYELQLRDLNTSSYGLDLPISYSSEFLWNRDFTLRWDLTKALKMSFSSATQAEIEEPEVTAVNKALYPDEYSMWKDSVKHSLLSLGRPLDYRQNFTASYQLPLNKLPIFDWITSEVKYSATYTWERGIAIEGNTITNNRSIDVNGRFNMETLYNKVPFLKETNRKFAANSRSSNNNRSQAAKRVKKFEQEVQLKADTTVTLSHNLNSKRPKITALTQEGNRYIVKYKVLDGNKIRIDNQDSIKIKINIVPGPKPEDQNWYKAAQYTSRFAMMLRNLSITYRNTYAMNLPGFLPEVGDILGQKKNDGTFAPGLGFAFGLQGNDYLQKAWDRGWLMNDSTAYPANTNAMEDLQIRMTLEPFKDFKVDLNASRTTNKALTIDYMFPDEYGNMPQRQNGSFNMTVISIGSAFGGRNANNGYQSKSFDKFIKNLDVFQQRVEAQYIGFNYPKTSEYAGKQFGVGEAEEGMSGIDKYSADVMIPAFLSAYTGKSETSSSLNFFPSLLAMLPNWSVSYNGLSKLPFFKKHFKSFTLKHGYRSVYSIGSYSTYDTFEAVIGDLGFRTDVVTETPVPSSRFNITNVSINEQFNPLIGVDMTFLNNITGKVEFRKTRVLNLSVSAIQLVETNSDDFVVGMGYKLVNVNLFGGSKPANSKDAVSNDLTLNADVTFKNQSALSRNIYEDYTQATSGNKTFKISCSANYILSKLMTLSFYYERLKNNPLVSSTSYPTTTSDFGISVRLSLTR